MPQWRVWNMHPEGKTHKESFRGDMIEIPAGKYVLMDYEDAYQFKGQYFPMKFNGDGFQEPSSFKVLKLEPHDGSSVSVPTKFVCQMDGKVFESQAALDSYTRMNFADKTFKDDALEETLASTAPPAVAKKKPGRPKQIQQGE